MIKHQDNNFSPYDHDELISLIPWYVKGKLTANETAALMQHLSGCESCRKEVSNCKALADSLPEPTESWQPSAAHFAGILANVDKLEAVEKLEKPANTVPKAGFFQRIRQLFAQTPRPVRWTLAAESFAFAILAAVMVLPGRLTTDQTGAFETLSTAETTSSSDQMIRLVISDEMTAKELSELLLQTKAQIRQGPSEVGAYTVELPSGDAATQAQAALRANPKVKLALPVAANAPKP